MSGIDIYHPYDWHRLREAMPNTATRLITLIMLLQSQPNQKAAELAAQLGVSVRSLHRYMAMLEEMGIPIYTERGPYGGFSLVPGYKMPPLALTPEEAVAVALGTGLVSEMWGQLYREAAQGALAKLDRLLPEEQRAEIAWARRALISTGLNRGDQAAVAPLLEQLRRAVREQRRVEMLYQGGSRPEPERRQVNPYALVHRWGWWYLVGYCSLRQAVRSFRVDRILELAVKAEEFQPGEGFDIRRYLQEEWKVPAPVVMRMRFKAEAAFVARAGRNSWERIDELPDGSVEVSFSAPDLYWAASTALSFGPQVEVLAPPELRELLKEWAADIGRRYEESGEQHENA